MQLATYKLNLFAPFMQMACESLPVGPETGICPLYGIAVRLHCCEDQLTVFASESVAAMAGKSL